MDHRLGELGDADVDRGILQMIGRLPTVEEQQETLQEVDQAVYYLRWQRRIEAALHREDASGPRAKRQRVQAGHNSSGPLE